MKAITGWNFRPYSPMLQEERSFSPYICRLAPREGGFTADFIDNGAGIAPEELPTVWDRYYRSRDVHKRAVVGTGLGLSIVRKILDLHGARYGVSSAVGQGSDFWFELPTEE